ncbi:MAG: hypothetical protein II592_06220, partial [Muribaculaceae bacterium]|nr:hypothetical protein [Muribaculaceae bacterium]
MKCRFLSMLMSVVTSLMYVAVAATTHTVTFDFSTVDGLNAMSIAVPATGGRTYLENNATFTLG